MDVEMHNAVLLHRESEASFPRPSHDTVMNRFQRLAVLIIRLRGNNKVCIIDVSECMEPGPNDSLVT